MRSIIKIIWLSLCLSILLVACKDEASVQTYFVDHQDLPEYKQIDLSAKLLDLSDTELSNEEQETLKSFKKISFLGYRIKAGDLDTYNKELAKATLVFNNEKYNGLMDFSMQGVKVNVSVIGTDEAIDEVLLLLSNKETGFGIARILGDDMNLEKILKLLNTVQSTDMDSNEFKDIIGFFN